jgi:TolB-like protein/thioredoxin-like negative regulator of GroEL
MIYQFGNTTVDTLRAEIRRGQKAVPLRRKSFDVLVCLLRNPHRVVTKTELLDAVWGDKVVTEGSLKSCITEIRSAIGDVDRNLIRTVPRRGYMLDAPLRIQAASILVAPIDDQNIEADSSYVADGLTEEIIIELSKHPSFRVISYASAMRLKDKVLQNAARELDVDYILEGSIRRNGDMLRVTLQLRNVDASEAQWSERYSGTLAELFDMHDQVAAAVTAQLTQHTASPTSARKEKLEDSQAVESYLRARYEMYKFSREGLQQAEQHLSNGLVVVGPNIRLLATLGHVYARYSEIGLDPEGQLLEKAAGCATAVFDLDPDSPLGYALLGHVQFHSGALRSAREPLERSVAARATDPDTHLMLGYLYALIGRNQQASDLFAEALTIDPLTPINHCMPGFVALMEGRNTDALSHYRQFFRMDPYNAFALWSLAYVLLRNGEIGEASNVVDELRLNHPNSIMTSLADAILSGIRGNRDACRNALTSELRQAARYSELFSREITHCLALIGDIDDALDWFANTIRIGNINYPFWAEHNDWVDSMRRTRRFRTILGNVEREWLSVNSSG